jgi:hypothetical protein
MIRAGRRCEDVLEVTTAEDQKAIEALAPDGADPPFRVRSRLRRPYWRFDYTDALGAKDLVELTGELAVAVTDKKARAHVLVVKRHEQVARLLGHPAAIRIRRHTREVHAARRELDEEQHVEALQEQGVDGEEVALEDARRLSPQKLAPALLESLRSRLDPCFPEDRPYGAGGELDLEPDQLTLDPPVPPARVLPRQPHHELTHPRWRRRPS